ncbi:MAG: GDP-mannose 4,6-dehydratase, partial [Deltaproteobacteria bacterium]|nr:GDP-mannose 4,6-dehydratase [Deltaproteobacteria bacterium]
VVRTRAFNHTGPRRSDVFVTSNFARQIAEIEAGLRDPVIRVGNLEAKRDFSDIRDVVRAYVLALEQGEAGEVYNIGSGKPHSISKVLEMLLGMSRCVIRIEQDPSRMRPSDIPVLVADTEKFRRKTGWRPRWSLEESLSDLLNSWRERIATGKPAQPLPVPTHGAARRRQVVKA